MTDLDQTIDTLADELAEIIIKGGPTSGNWGHSGRKGKKGGSGGGGGFRRIGVKDGKAGRKGIKRASRQTRAKDERGKLERKKYKRTNEGDKLFNKVKHGGTLKLVAEDGFKVDVSIKAGSGVTGMALKTPGQKKFGKHSIRSSQEIKNYLDQFRERDAGAKPKPKKPAKPKSEPLGKLTSSQDKLVNLGVEKLKVSRNKVLSDAKKVSDAFGRAGEGVDNSSAIGNALQMISAGGLDKWMDKFGKESIMRQTIEPELRKEFG